MSLLGLKSEWAVLLLLCGGVHDVSSLRFPFGATPAELLTANMAVKLFSYGDTSCT